MGQRLSGSRRLRLVALGAGLAAALALTLALSPFPGDGDDPTQALEAGSVRPVTGVPAGYPRSEAGAIQAAVDYQLVRSSKTYLTDTRARLGVIDAIAASESVEALFFKEELATRRLLESHGLTTDTADMLVARAAVLGTRTVGYTDEAAKIQVWSTGLLGVPDSAEARPVAATWTTHTVALRWQTDDWKLVGVGSDPGPTPLENHGTIPSTDQELRLADRMFRVPPFTSWDGPASTASAT